MLQLISLFLLLSFILDRYLSNKIKFILVFLTIIILMLLDLSMSDSQCVPVLSAIIFNSSPKGPKPKLIQATEIKGREGGKEVVRAMDYAFHVPGEFPPLVVLAKIYEMLQTMRSYQKLGNVKIIIAAVSSKDRVINLHSNTLVTSSTSTAVYINSVRVSVKKVMGKVEDEYLVEWSEADVYIVKVWDMTRSTNAKIKLTKIGKAQTKLVKSQTRGYATSAQCMAINKSKPKLNKLGFISPLKRPAAPPEILPFAAGDVETVVSPLPVAPGDHPIEYPISIAITYFKVGGVNYESCSKFFIIKDVEAFKRNPEAASLALFKEFLEFLDSELGHVDYIFFHNLSKFDGIFILKYLGMLSKSSDFNSLFDDEIGAIRLQYKHFNVIDSKRIFDMSLQSLCDVFIPGEGKASKYNAAFHNISMFHNRKLLALFIKYAKQDTRALFQALLAATIEYNKKYHINLCESVSVSSLSFKIFRQDFLETPIPLLRKTEDIFIRESYYGGSTDFYKKYATKLFYYDVNSLYPYAMLNDMPLAFLGYVKGSDIKLGKFFGFILAQVTCPDDIINPVLIYRNPDTNKVVHPRGTSPFPVISS